MDVELYKKILKENNMTYSDLALQTGLSLGCIKRIMAGIARFPRIDTIEQIENALGIGKALTSDEKAAGASATKKESITPDEDEMLYWFREVEKKFGDKGKESLIAIAKNMVELN